ncbi:MAG: segregation and condensation protein A [Phycisphaerales bacterium JB043]
MSQTEYQVRLDAFEGPLDLLLYLIRKAEVEITDIPIATITRQYLSFLEHIDQLDIDLAGDFLVMAATLMEIKSRTIAPASTDPDDEDAQAGEPDLGELATEALDPRAELVQQLLEYKRYRDAAEHLEDRATSWAQRFAAPGAAYDKDSVRTVLEEQSEHELEDLSTFDLVEAFARITAAVDFRRIGEHHVEMETDDTPLEVHAQDIAARLEGSSMLHEGEPALRLVDVFLGRPRVQMIGLFLAMLEMARQRRIRVIQHTDVDEILIVGANDHHEEADGPEDSREPA